MFVDDIFLRQQD